MVLCKSHTWAVDVPPAGQAKSFKESTLPLLPPLIRHLKSPDLFGSLDRLPALGKPVSERTFVVLNPSTGEVLAELPDMGVEETRTAIDRAYRAQPGWAALTARERSDVLWRWHQLIIDHADDLAAILTAEMGKPLAEANSEVSHAAAYTPKRPTASMARRSPRHRRTVACW